MRMFGNLMRTEWLKLRRSSIWLLIFVSPLLSAAVGVGTIRQESKESFTWLNLLETMTLPHGLLFLPLLAGVFAAFVCRYEHDSGGWKQLLAMPVSRTSVYLAKLMSVSLLIIGTQLLFLVSLLAVGWFYDMGGSIPWTDFIQSLVGGLVACLPLAALQLAVSVGWANFAAPLSINVIFTIPNVIIVNSATYAPFYPWAQPFLAMLPDVKDGFGALNLSFQSLMLVVVGGFVVFLAGGLTYFRTKEI